jgi:hypothetical protein
LSRSSSLEDLDRDEISNILVSLEKKYCYNTSESPLLKGLNLLQIISKGGKNVKIDSQHIKGTNEGFLQYIVDYLKPRTIYFDFQGYANIRFEDDQIICFKIKVGRRYAMKCSNISISVRRSKEDDLVISWEPKDKVLYIVRPRKELYGVKESIEKRYRSRIDKRSAPYGLDFEVYNVGGTRPGYAQLRRADYVELVDMYEYEDAGKRSLIGGAYDMLVFTRSSNRVKKIGGYGAVAGIIRADKPSKLKVLINLDKDEKISITRILHIKK